MVKSKNLAILPQLSTTLGTASSGQIWSQAWLMTSSVPLLLYYSPCILCRWAVTHKRQIRYGKRVFLWRRPYRIRALAYFWGYASIVKNFEPSCLFNIIRQNLYEAIHTKATSLSRNIYLLWPGKKVNDYGHVQNKLQGTQDLKPSGYR